MSDVQSKTGRLDQRTGAEQMTLIAARIRVLNSLLFIRDSSVDALPTIDGSGAVWSTASCVAVSCLPDCDGATEIVIGDLAEVQGDAAKLVFDRLLETPSRIIVVQTVVGEKLLQREVPAAVTRTRIWTNGLRDTDKVIIGVA